MTNPEPPIMLGLQALPGARRCGLGRSPNSIYLEIGLSPYGSPIEEFLFDPTRPLPESVAASISKIGVNVIPDAQSGHDVLDWVGTSHYAYATDFIEEGRLKGFSRKISPSLDFSLLTPGSRLIFAHERAWVENFEEYGPHTPDFKCPCGLGHGPGEDCIGLLYRLAPPETGDTRYALPGGATYPVGPLDPAAPAPIYRPAIFAWGHITSIALIANPDGSYDEAKYAAASAAGIPVSIPKE